MPWLSGVFTNAASAARGQKQVLCARTLSSGLQENNSITFTMNTVILSMCHNFWSLPYLNHTIFVIIGGLCTKSASLTELLWCQLIYQVSATLMLRIILALVYYLMWLSWSMPWFSELKKITASLWIFPMIFCSYSYQLTDCCIFRMHVDWICVRAKTENGSTIYQSVSGQQIYLYHMPRASLITWGYSVLYSAWTKSLWFRHVAITSTCIIGWSRV